MKKINFVKMDGAGNDFILIDALQNKGISLNPELIKNLCDRRKGIGADGILLIDKPKDFDFELKYFNSDGSLGSLCGNGARCSIKYALDNFDIKNSQTKFLCNNKTYFGSVNPNGEITFHLSDVTEVKKHFKVKFDKDIINGFFTNTGSPHFIIFWNDIKHLFVDNFMEFDIYNFGKKIRLAEEFSPDGTNVNVIYSEENKNYIRTYERGVEEETLACGTGTVASAIILFLNEKNKLPISFFTKGGDILKVNFEENNEIFSKITLTGPAKINYIGSYNF